MATASQQLNFAIRAINEAKNELSSVRGQIGDIGDEAGKGEPKVSKFGGALGDVAKIAGGFIVAQGLLKLPGLIGGAVGEASDLAEAGSKVNVVFGENANTVQTWASNAAKALGLSKVEALSAAGTFGNLFDALGLSSQASLDMSMGVIQLSTDLGSFNNLGTPEVLEKIRAGLVGEAEPLRSLGININAATVEAKAMEMGLADADGQLSESAKVQARYALIVEQSTNAQGDFERTSDGLANQQKILNAQLANVRAEIGEKLIPIALALTSTFNEKLIPAIEWATDNTDKLAPAAAALGVILLAALTPSIIAATTATWAFTAALLANPMTWVVLGIAALVAAIVLLVQHWDWITEKVPFLGTAFDAVKSVIENYLIPALTAIWSFLKDDLWPIIQSGIDLYLTPLKIAFEALQTALSFAKAHFETFKSALEKTLDPIQWVIDKLRGLKNAITSLPSMPDLTPGFSLPKFGFAKGLWEVPGPRNVDYFPALLAGGEMVVPARQADVLRGGTTQSASQRSVINMPIYAEVLDVERFKAAMRRAASDEIDRQLGPGAVQWGAA